MASDELVAALVTKVRRTMVARPEENGVRVRLVTVSNT